MKISIAIYHPLRVVQESFRLYLASNTEFVVKETCTDLSELPTVLRQQMPNILIYSLENSAEENLKMIKSINLDFSRIRILILSSQKALIAQSIKVGAKGFIHSTSSRSDLFEAIYTIRAGYDYYTEPITHLLLDNYLDKIDNKEQCESSQESSGLELLSDRQIEIIRLWGSNMTNQEIADKLFISVRTVESHKNHIMQRLNFKTNIDMLKFGIRNNLIDL